MTDPKFPCVVLTLSQWNELWDDEPEQYLDPAVPDDEIPALVLQLDADSQEWFVVGVTGVTLH